MAVFKDNNKWQAFVDEVEARATAQGVIECPGCDWGRAQGDIDFAEGKRRVQQDSAFQISWASWVRQVLPDVLDEPSRMVFIQEIAKRPRAAAGAYLNIADLSEAEDDVLLKSWHSSRRIDAKQVLPRIEAELADGRVVRKKTV